MSDNPVAATRPRPVGKRTRRTDDDARAVEAMRLRLAGLDYAEIATLLGYADKSGAYRAATRALESVKHETAREMLDLELGRLDVLLATLWPAATTGDLAALDRVLKVMDRRAKYLGLDTDRLMAEYVQEIERYRMQTAVARMTPKEIRTRLLAHQQEVNRRVLEMRAEEDDTAE